MICNSTISLDKLAPNKPGDILYCDSQGQLTTLNIGKPGNHLVISTEGYPVWR